MTEDEKLKLL
jgi:hypothetical protein